MKEREYQLNDWFRYHSKGGVTKQWISKTTIQSFSLFNNEQEKNKTD